MPQTGVPSTEQLLDLLRRAAEELRASREETARAKQETAAAQEELVRVQQQFAAERDKLTGELQMERQAQEDLAARIDGDRTAMIQPKKKGKKKGGQAPLEVEPVPDGMATVMGLDVRSINAANAANAANGAATDAMKAEVEAARRALEQEQEAHLATRQSLDIERQQALEAVERNLVASRQEVADLREQLRLEQGRTNEMGEQVAQAQSEREAVKARLDAAEAAQQVFEQQRQELEESHRVQLVEAQQQQQQAEAGMSQEKEKHQVTAQKWVTERERVREMERAEEEMKKRIAQLDTDFKALNESTARALADRDAQLKEQETAHLTHMQGIERSFIEQSATRESLVQQLTAQLETTNNERMYVERKFEELHRELLVVLEQRDEARRQLEATQSERQRLERALTQQTRR